MTSPPRDNRWLDALVAAELERFDVDAARARLPEEVREQRDGRDLAPAAQVLVARSLRRHPLAPVRPPAGLVFAEEMRAHVTLLLDLALVRGDGFDPARARREIAAFLAAVVGEDDLAVAAYAPGRDFKAVARALRAAGVALRAALFPPGDPVHGLPLHPGRLAVQRRHLARIAMGHHRHGRLDPDALARHAEYAARELALLVEALSGLVGTASAPAHKTALAVREKQLRRLGLSGEPLAEARRALAAPRTPEALGRAAPARVRPFLLEQLHLALLRARLDEPDAARWVEAFAAAAKLDPGTVAAARIEAAAQHDDHQVWFDAFDAGGSSWRAFSSEWDAAADQLVERVTAAVTGNLDAFVTEVRETGELGALLAKAAGGAKLTADEKRKVRAQLVDLAKAVPALAIFAAPGGMLLLPLLAKLLPFNLMPSAWEKPAPLRKAPAGELPEGAKAARKARAG